MRCKNHVMTAPRIISRFAALISLMVLVGCASVPDPNVRVIEAADLSSFETFAFVRDDPMVRRSLSFPELNSLAADRAIRVAIEKEMGGKGYALVPRDRADLLVSYALGVREFADLPEDEEHHHFRTRDSRNTYVSGRRTEVTVTVIMTERHTGIELWNALGQADWPEGDTITPIINQAVKAALTDVQDR